MQGEQLIDPLPVSGPSRTPLSVRRTSSCRAVSAERDSFPGTAEPSRCIERQSRRPRHRFAHRHRRPTAQLPQPTASRSQTLSLQASHIVQLRRFHRFDSFLADCTYM